MRLKPWLTARISGVEAFSSSGMAAHSPERTWAVARDRACSGWLISRASTAAPVSDSNPAITSQISQVRPWMLATRCGSSSSQ